MKGSVAKFINFLIYVLLFVTVIFSLTLVAHGTPTAQHECISAQSGEISYLKMKVEDAIGRGATLQHSFYVLDCVKCMWYNDIDEQLIVVYAIRRGYFVPEELWEVPYNISTKFVNIGCNCNDCDQEIGGTYCANLRRDDDISSYQFWVNKTHIECMNCRTSAQPC